LPNFVTRIRIIRGLIFRCQMFMSLYFTGYKVVTVLCVIQIRYDTVFVLIIK